MRRLFLTSIVMCAFLFAGRAEAQVQADTATEAEPTTDARELMGRVLKRSSAPPPERDDRKATWFRIPFISSSPGTGTLMGGGGEVTFFRGDPSTTKASTMVGNFAASFNGHAVAGVRISLHGDGNRWMLFGDNRFERMTQSSYGLGTASVAADRFAAGYSQPRVNDVALRRVHRSLYAGVGFHFSRHVGVGSVEGLPSAWARSAYVQYSNDHGFDLGGQGSTGASLNVRFDSRDSSVSATRGALVAASYRTYVKGFLGGDSNWQQVNLDLRGYRNLGGSERHTLAAWGYADLVTGGVAPYFDLPATASDMQGRSGRGYAVGRFRGERLVYGEVEYRARLTRNGLVGLVAFLNATTVSSRATGERLFQSVAPGAGVGVRLLADKFSRTSICLDAAIGRNGSRGIYLALQEAF